MTSPSSIFSPSLASTGKQANEILEKEEYVCAGIITAPHGLHGHVRLKCFLDNPTTFKTYSPYYNEEREEAYHVAKVLSQDKDMLVIALDNTRDRNSAERLKGAKLMLPRTDLPDLEHDTYYHADLIGIRVFSSTTNDLGHIQALYNFGAGDILEIKTPLGKLVMLPFTQDMVVEIDLKEKTAHLSKAADMVMKEGSDAP